MDHAGNPRPAIALDLAVPLPDRLAALAGWWEGESRRLLSPAAGSQAAEVVMMRKQRGYQYSLCAEDLRRVLTPPR